MQQGQILCRFKDGRMIRIMMSWTANLRNSQEEKRQILNQICIFHQENPKLRKATWETWNLFEENLDQLIEFTGKNSHQLGNVARTAQSFDFR